MSRINLTNLETVCCIARVGTFRAAADRLHTTQPAITARVREIENSLGIQLFQKRGRGMELTVEGRQFVDRVAPLVRQLEEAVLAHSDASASRGVVRVGVGAVTMTWFSPLLAALKRDMPMVDYELTVDMGMNMLTRLESGKLDLAVVAGKHVRVPGMHCLPLKPSQLQWVMSSRIPRVVDDHELSPAELLDSAPVWLVAKSSILYAPALHAARRLGARLHNISTCGSMIGLVDVIDKGVGIGLVATELAKDRLASGALLPVSHRLQPITLELTLLFSKDQPQPVVRMVADHIAEADARRESLQTRVEYGLLHGSL
ncbi:MAG: LysR family transcriptional regulator [Pigmentiphaga sp.]